MDEAQITGAASSYARKYALNGLFALDDVQEADDDGTGEKEAPINQKQTDWFEKVFNTENKQTQLKELLDTKFQKESVLQLTEAQASELMQFVRANVKK